MTVTIYRLCVDGDMENCIDSKSIVFQLVIYFVIDQLIIEMFTVSVKLQLIVHGCRKTIDFEALRSASSVDGVSSALIEECVC